MNVTDEIAQEETKETNSVEAGTLENNSLEVEKFAPYFAVRKSTSESTSDMQSPDQTVAGVLESAFKYIPIIVGKSVCTTDSEAESEHSESEHTDAEHTDAQKESSEPESEPEPELATTITKAPFACIHWNTVKSMVPLEERRRAHNHPSGYILEAYDKNDGKGVWVSVTNYQDNEIRAWKNVLDWDGVQQAVEDMVAELDGKIVTRPGVEPAADIPAA